MKDKYIVLTKELAEKITGKHGDYCYLLPFSLTLNGVEKYYLPEKVLQDPDYKIVWNLLNGCEILEISEDEISGL